MGSHLIHRDVWNKVGGFSEEYYPGTGSDPDLGIWNFGILCYIQRLIILKSLCLLVIRKGKITLLKRNSSRGGKFSKVIPLNFRKFYLKSDTIYRGELTKLQKI